METASADYPDSSFLTSVVILLDSRGQVVTSITLLFSSTSCIRKCITAIANFLNLAKALS